MTELMAKIYLKVLKICNDSHDMNDVWSHIEMIQNNEDEVERQLRITEWRISNNYNSKTTPIREIGFYNQEITGYENEDTEDEKPIREQKCFVHTYVFDGDGSKRIVRSIINPDYVTIEKPYIWKSCEEISKMAAELKTACHKVLGNDTDYTDTNIAIEQLKDYSEKCFNFHGMFIPKSVVKIHTDIVLIASWFYRKNKIFIDELSKIK